MRFHNVKSVLFRKLESKETLLVLSAAFLLILIIIPLYKQVYPGKDETVTTSRSAEDRVLATSTQNLIQNGSFETTGSGWFNPIWWLFVRPGSSASASVYQDSSTYTDGKYSVRVNIGAVGSILDDVNIHEGNISVTAGQSYTASFWARASSNRTIKLYIQQSYSPWNWYFIQPFNITTAWQQYTVTFTQSTSDTNIELALNDLSLSTGYILFDNVSLVNNGKAQVGNTQNAPVTNTPVPPTPTPTPACGCYINGFPFVDTYGNGVYNSTADSLYSYANSTLSFSLYDSYGNFLARQTQNAGQSTNPYFYSFNKLLPNTTYTVKLDAVPSGYTLTTAQSFTVMMGSQCSTGGNATATCTTDGSLYGISFGLRPVTVPTATLFPTNTPRPTATPVPTATPTIPPHDPANQQTYIHPTPTIYIYNPVYPTPTPTENKYYPAYATPTPTTYRSGATTNYYTSGNTAFPTPTAMPKPTTTPFPVVITDYNTQIIAPAQLPAALIESDIQPQTGTGSQPATIPVQNNYQQKTAITISPDQPLAQIPAPAHPYGIRNIPDNAYVQGMKDIQLIGEADATVDLQLQPTAFTQDVIYIGRGRLNANGETTLNWDTRNTPNGVYKLYVVYHTSNNANIAVGPEQVHINNPQAPLITQVLIPQNVSPQVINSMAVDKTTQVDEIKSVKTEDNDSAVSLSGKSLPNTFITLVIFSTPIMVTVKTDANGLWTYTLEKPLPSGDHTTYALLSTANGKQIRSDVAQFFIPSAFAASSNNESLMLESPSENYPVTLYLLVSSAMVFIGVSVLVVLYAQKKSLLKVP